jgi:hypothetical protein
MNSARTLIKTCVICLIPLLACSIYYTSERLDDLPAYLYISAQMALPLLLISCAYLANLAVMGKCTGWRLYTSAIAIVLSILTIGLTWL